MWKVKLRRTDFTVTARACTSTGRERLEDQNEKQQKLEEKGRFGFGRLVDDPGGFCLGWRGLGAPSMNPWRPRRGDGPERSQNR